MKVNVFMPKYMKSFKCIGPKCTDTCCAGWDINIDEDSFNKYNESSGLLKTIVAGKYKSSENNDDYFNAAFMILEDDNKCPFLNNDKLCDIHGKVGEEHLCITCKNYPRVFNIVDEVYEKSGLTSCEEVCFKALLNKEKMEFIESEEDIEIDNIEIRRIFDSEAFEEEDNLLNYFWNIRVISINILQERKYSIEKRLNILVCFYNKIMECYKKEDFLGIEELLEHYSEEIEDIKDEVVNINLSNDYLRKLASEEIVSNLKSFRLKECIAEYKNALEKYEDINGVIIKNSKLIEGLNDYAYVLENYLVNKVFQTLSPFNKGEDLLSSVKMIVNTYKIIKGYIIGIAVNNDKFIDEKDILRVIQAVSKEIEHNKIYRNLIEDAI